MKTIKSIRNVCHLFQNRTSPTSVLREKLSLCFSNFNTRARERALLDDESFTVSISSMHFVQFFLQGGKKISLDSQPGQFNVTTSDRLSEKCIPTLFCDSTRCATYAGRGARCVHQLCSTIIDPTEFLNQCGLCLYRSSGRWSPSLFCDSTSWAIMQGEGHVVYISFAARSWPPGRCSISVDRVCFGICDPTTRKNKAMSCSDRMFSSVNLKSRHDTTTM